MTTGQIFENRETFSQFSAKTSIAHPRDRESNPLTELPGQAKHVKTGVGGAGFEPAKAEPTDLQSVPFDRFGTPPTQAHYFA